MCQDFTLYLLTFQQVNWALLTTLHLHRQFQAGLTVTDVTFEKWSPEKMAEEEGVDGDNHDQANLSAQEMSKFVLCL